MENLKLLIRLYFRPASAMSELMDNGQWLLAAVFVFAVSITFYVTVNAKLEAAYSVPQFDLNSLQRFEEDAGSETVETAKRRGEMIAEYQKMMSERATIPLIGDRFFWFFSFDPKGFIRPLISLLCFYVPLSILLVSLFGSLGSFGANLQRDYGTFSVCTMMAWTAAHLPFAIAGVMLYSQSIPPFIYFGFWLLSGLAFGLFMILAVRVVFGVNYSAAIAVVAISWISFSLGIYVFKFISPFLFSPFLLIMAYMYFGGAISGGANGLGSSFRQRQNFKRFLQTATINPRDADAHVQLGLIYNQRRQTEAAFKHFSKAIEIDRDEIDANYELGRIRRRRGELSEAIKHFSVVVEQHDKYALSEIWREIGATYLDAKMYTEARNALETFVTRRAVDSEGLYYLGKVLKEIGEPEKARDMFLEAIESARISPAYRRRELNHWRKLAEKEI